MLVNLDQNVGSNFKANFVRQFFLQPFKKQDSTNRDGGDEHEGLNHHVAPIRTLAEILNFGRKFYDFDANFFNFIAILMVLVNNFVRHIFFNRCLQPCGHGGRRCGGLAHLGRWPRESRWLGPNTKSKCGSNLR